MFKVEDFAERVWLLPAINLLEQYGNGVKSETLIKLAHKTLLIDGHLNMYEINKQPSETGVVTYIRCYNPKCKKRAQVNKNEPLTSLTYNNE